MEDYLKHIEIFHKDYLYSLTNKEKYVKCKQCENKKQFIIDDNHMIYNCGAEGSGVCGDQFKINIPDYIHYEKIMKAFQSTIHGSFNYNSDIYDLSEYDLNILSKHLPLTEENNEYQETKQTILKDSERLTSFFVSSNKLKEYYDQLSTFNNEYQKNMTKKKKILYDLENDITLTLEDKIRMRKEYAKIIKNEMNEKYPIYESFINTQLNHYLLLNPEEKYVEKYQTRYLDQKTPQKKDKAKKSVQAKKEKISKEKEYVFDKDHKGYQMCKQLSENKLSDSKIKENRKEIYDEIMKYVGNEEINVDNFTDLLTEKEMKLLFELYDQTFFQKKLSELSKNLGCQWVICWNNRCSTTAGRQTCKIDGSCKMIHIELSSKVFRDVLKKMEQDGNDFISMDGKNNCDSILSCLQLTFEHELVHALQDCFCTDWMKSKKGPGIWEGKKGPGSSHSKTFMSILNNTFGHIDYKHKLFKSGDKKRKEEKEDTKKVVDESNEDESNENKSKGLGDQLEELQVDIMKGVSKAEEEQKKKNLQ